MMERRKPKYQIGRRKSDIPVVVLEQFKSEMDARVEKSIEKHVNGGIREINHKLDGYIEADKEWKVRAEPVVTAFENSKWTLKVFVGFLKFLVLIVPSYAGYLWIKNLFK